MTFCPNRRAEGVELMDSETCAPEDFEACLRDLAQVNRFSLGYRPTLLFLETLRREGRLPRERPLRVLDVGSGYGDGLRRIARWGRARGVALSLTGLDRHPHATAAAHAEDKRQGEAIAYVTAALFDHRPQPRPDLVLSALFAHHLNDEDLPRFLGWMEREARIGWFVNDLERSRLSLHGFALLARGLGWHRFVRHDGPLSIARSFRPADWRRLLAEAGLPEGHEPDGGSITLRRHFPYRLCLARIKPLSPAKAAPS